MMWSWVQPGLLCWLKCHLFHEPSRWENYCTDAREGEKTPQQSVLFAVTWYSVHVPSLANLYMHSWKNHCKFRFHCTCTDQLSSTWNAKWTSRGKNEFAANGYTVYASRYTGRGQSAEDVTVASHYENLSQLPPKYSCCNVASNYSLLLQCKG